MLNIITLHLIDNRNLLIPVDIYQSAITLKLLRGEVNVIDRLITVAPVRGLRYITQRVSNHFLIYWCLFSPFYFETGLLQLTPGLSLRAIWPLELILNSAAQLSWLKKPAYFSHTTLLLHFFHWLLVYAHILYETLKVAYKAKNVSAPTYLKAHITPHTAARSLWSSSTASHRHLGCGMNFP